MFTEIGRIKFIPYYLQYLPHADPEAMWSVHQQVRPNHLLEVGYPFLASATWRALTEGLVTNHEGPGKFYSETLYLPDTVMPSWKRMSEVALTGLQALTFNQGRNVPNLYIHKQRGNVLPMEVRGASKTLPVYTGQGAEQHGQRLDVRQVVRSGLSLILGHAWLRAHVAASGDPGVLSYPQI